MHPREPQTPSESAGEPTPDDGAVMTDAEFETLRRLIAARSGLRFPPGRKYLLESRLSGRLAELGLASFGDYAALLNGRAPGDEACEREFQEVLSRVTINETSFFRDPSQLDAFERVVLPELLSARHDSRRLRLWSAACSTGEEAYTLAIILHRTLGDSLGDWHVEILGSDISRRALGLAARAAFGEPSLRGVDLVTRERYFQHRGMASLLCEEIARMVRFEPGNLMLAGPPAQANAWDVIFCRNALIYFDPPDRHAALASLADQLAGDGSLFLGQAEAIDAPDARFQALHVGESVVYRKAAGARAAA